jgi:hypothetical protein
MSTQSHIYLIQDGKDIGTSIFKLGKSKQGINDVIKLKRIKDYSNGTIQHNTWLVSYTLVDDIENEIKKQFKNKYILVRGHEWFEGDVKQMKKDIDYIIDNYNTENYTLIEPVKKITEPQSVNTWRTHINHTSYEFIDEFLLNIFVNKEDVNMFKEYIINILDNKENHYGVLIIPGFTNGDILLDILRLCLGDYYNRYNNPRNAKERLIRHDGDYSIKVIKENQNCHHVYLWCKNITNIKEKYEKNKIRYTLCDILKDPEYHIKFDEFRRKLTKDAIFTMLINYFEL